MKKIKNFSVIAAFIILSLGCLVFTGCGQEEETLNNDITPTQSVPSVTEPVSNISATPTPVPCTPTEEPVITEAPVITQEPEITEAIPTEEPEPTMPVIPEGMVKSQLTGLWIPEETANYRPYAIMINNIRVASPQSGLSDADILYEILVEYGITRFMAIFEADDALAENSNRIGSVRSARHYYIDFAQEYDAIFVHFGKTSYAEKQITAQNIDDIDGIDGRIASSAFYRDSAIQSPHNVFLKLSTLISAVDNSSIRSQKINSQESFFNFYEEDTVPEGGNAANKVTINFSEDTKPYLVYDPETGLYNRYNFGVLHVDDNTDEVLSFKNIIVQFVDQYNIGSHGYKEIALAGNTGSGYYITNGSYIPITWTKSANTNERHFLDASGNELNINAGKTYFAIVPDTNVSGVVFE